MFEQIKYYYRVLRSIIAAYYYENPSSNLKLVGVTGTSGKSTTSAMIYHILNENGIKVGLISTVGAKIGQNTLDTGFHVTTPDPIQLQKYLKFMKDHNAEYVVLETSSHALAQGRLGLLKFDFAVFTNIQNDHLDWHKTWENYAASKFKLARKLKSNGFLIFNKDDKKSYNFITTNLKNLNLNQNKIIEYGLEKNISDIKEDLSGLSFQFFGHSTHINIIGRYNIYNFIAASEVAKNLGLSIDQIVKSMESFKGIEGRMQIIKSDPFTVIVDFAHNADSLENSLKSIHHIKNLENKIICVFGSAGLRDKQKRFDMGKVSGESADITIITAEDPRTESLREINSAIIEGIKSSGGNLLQRFGSHEEYLEFLKEYEILTENDNDLNFSSSAISVTSKSVFSFDYESVQNRYDAIDFAIRLAHPGDIVITEGKGHEQSLAFGDKEYTFSDQEALTSALSLISKR